LANHRLWAPWRLQYIKSDKGNECIFCEAAAAGDDARSLIPHRGSRCFVMLNAFPYTSGHVMVAPYEHTSDLAELDADTGGELIGLAQLSLRAIDRTYGPEGYNLGMNLGEIAGAGVADHLHLHVVPRWAGDTNFMTVAGDTRVLPQTLEDSYTALREAFSTLA
jgi:ATP adenylyltransferase